MTTHEVRLTGRDEIAAGTMAFHFEKPAGFCFKPGQAVDVVLANRSGSDPQSPRHTFSLVSAPFQDKLTVATRMRDSEFKRALRSLRIGSAAQVEGPFGSLTLHNNRQRPAVFIAGGIGITPFMSILRQAARDQLPQRLVLLYSNRRPEDAAFLTELRQLQQQNGNFHLIATMTEMNGSDHGWNGETRLIDEDFVKGATSGLAAPVCYLAGPPAMIEAVRQALTGAGVDDDDIRSEEFFGY